MKAFLKSVFCLILICFSSAASAQDELSMIRSSGELRAWALSRVTEVNVMLYMSSGGNAGYDYRAWSGKKPSAEILALAREISVSVSVFDPSETATLYTSFMDKDGNSLFYGYQNAKPEKVGNVWKLPDSIKNIELEMPAVLIPLSKPVSYAAIIAKDANGNSVWYELYVDGNRIWFPPASAGLDGRIQVNYADGSIRSYSIATGKLLNEVSIGSGAKPTFKEVYSWKNPLSVSLTVKSDHGHGVIPTLEIENTGIGRSIAFEVVTTDGKRPISYHVSYDGETWSAVDIISPTVTQVNLQIQSGITYVVPIWNTNEFTEDPQPIATGGGGKG